MKISLITVAYNSEQTIKDTIDSVLAQNYPQVEYLIIDGASTDNTLAIAQSYGERIQVVVSEPDAGIYDAMNKGIALATGDVVGFINADDFYPHASVLEQVAAAFSQESVEAVYGDLCYVKQEKKAEIVRYWRSSPFHPHSFAKGWSPPHPTFFVRRTVYKEFGGFNLNLSIAADIELMMRFLEVHRINALYLPVTMVHMRLGGTTNKSFKNIIKQNGQILSALKKHDLDHSRAAFFIHKLFSRAKQFLIKPTA